MRPEYPVETFLINLKKKKKKVFDRFRIIYRGKLETNAKPPFICSIIRSAKYWQINEIFVVIVPSPSVSVGPTDDAAQST
jgi:hypothetical protein